MTSHGIALDPEPLASFSLAECMAVKDPVWLVDGLLASSVNLLSAKPNAGKSALMTNFVASALTGRQFLGRDIRTINRIIVVGTDSSALAEYRDRLLTSGVDKNMVHERYQFIPAVRLDEQFCARLGRDIRPGAEDVVVFDHLSDMAGDFNSQVDVARMFAAIRSAAGDAAVIVLAHSSTTTGPTGHSSKKPLGSTVIAAKARWMLHLERRADDQCVLTTSGNLASGATLRLQVASHASDFSVTDIVTAKERSRNRRESSKKTLNERINQAEFYEQRCRDMSNAEASRELARQFGKKDTTWQNQLARGGQLRQLLDSRSHSVTVSPPIT